MSEIYPLFQFVFGAEEVFVSPEIMRKPYWSQVFGDMSGDFIAKNIDEFTYYTMELFNNNSLWNEIRQNLFSMRGKYSWKLSAQKFKEVLIK